MTEPYPNPVGTFGILLLVLTVLFGLAAERPTISAAPAPVAVVPLVDHAAIAAHADSANVPRAAAYALVWMETRSGKCLPRCPRGPGLVRVDSVVDGHVYSHRICREVGRMQINPCAGHDKRNPRCSLQRVKSSIDDNYACGMWYYRTLLDRYDDDQRRALSRYNGGNPKYAETALAQTGDWWFQGLLTERDRL